jgi:hypothetical protein
MTWWFLGILALAGFGQEAASGQKQGIATVRVTNLERMLPNDTLAFVHFKNVPQLIKRWNRLGFQSPVINPALQGVVARLEEHFPKQLLDAKPKWAEWLPAATGEACIAIVPAESGKPAVVLAMDIRDQTDKKFKSLKWYAQLKSYAQLYDQHGMDAPKIPDELSREEPPNADILRLFEKIPRLWFADDVLFAATEPGAIMKLLGLRDGKGGLSGSELYRDVMEQCQATAETVDPDVRFFVRPIEYLALRTELEKRKPPITTAQYLLQARATGFDAVRCVGGACWFDRDCQSLLYRVGIYAPDQTTTAMRMLLLPNRQQHEPPSWIPKDVAGFTSFFWEMPQVFDSFAKLFGPVMGDRFGFEADEDFFADLLRTLRDDPNGPQIDILGGCIQQLKQRVLVVCSPAESAGSVWDRTVYAFELKDETTVARAINKYVQALKSDNEVTEEKINGHTLHAIRACVKQDAVPEPVPEKPEISFGDMPPAVKKHKKQVNNAEEEEEENCQDPNRTIFLSVAHGHLLWGNNGELMKRLLLGGETLAEDKQYKSVQRELDRLADGPTSFRSFARYGDDFRLLTRCMDAGNFFTPFFLEAGTLDKQALAKKWRLARERRAAKIQEPSAKVLQPTRSPGPAGWFAKSLPNGWRIVGFVLPAETSTKKR